VDSTSDLGVFADLLDLQVTDGKIEAVTVKHGDEVLRIVRGETYSNDLKLLKQEPMIEVTKYRLTGVLGGDVPLIPEEFDDEADALRKKYLYEDKFYNVGTAIVIEPFITLAESTKV